MGEEKTVSSAPISIYMLDSEDEFEVAKGLNVAPDVAGELIKNADKKEYVTLFRELK